MAPAQDGGISPAGRNREHANPLGVTAGLLAIPDRVVGSFDPRRLRMAEVQFGGIVRPGAPGIFLCNQPD